MEKIEAKNDPIPSPYDIFCLQECEKMNSLLSEITGSLEGLYMGLDGALNMTDQMELLANSLTLNRIPDKWGSFYPSKKSLPNWFKELKLR
jgi:dynein heavy chain